jgi:hypothetical protein
MSSRIPTIHEVHDSTCKFSLSGGLEVLTSIDKKKSKVLLPAEFNENNLKLKLVYLIKTPYFTYMYSLALYNKILKKTNACNNNIKI